MGFQLAILLIAAACPLPACDLCACYRPKPNHGAPSSAFFVGFAEQYTSFNTVQLNSRQVPNQGGNFIHSSISQIFAGYDFNKRVGLQLNVPIIDRWFGFESQRSTVAGLGDLSLVGNLHLYQKSTEHFSFTWSALAGPKFPTGSTSHLNPNREDFSPVIAGHDITLGTGSFDGLLGTGFAVRSKRFFATGDMQYGVRSEGDYGYQFANDWVWLGGPGVYFLTTSNYTAGLQATVSGESKGEDTLRGISADDTALTAVYLGPHLHFAWRSKLAMELGADLPVSIESSGLQVVPDYRLRANLTWRF